VSGAALTIWITRNWNSDQVVVTAADLARRDLAGFFDRANASHQLPARHEDTANHKVKAHALHGLVVGFSARHAAERDFVRDPVTCNLTIGSLTHVSDDGWLLAVGAPALVGVGRLRDDAVARSTGNR
jgi:hypothetical protein